MAPRHMSDYVKLLFTLRVLLMFGISTASTKQCTSKKTERDSYVIKNVGIKLCHLKCAEHGQCASIEYNAETLTCRLLRDESKVEKKEGHVLARCHSHDPADSCKCSFGQRCLKARSGKHVCVEASTDPKPNTVSQVPVTTQDSHPQDSATGASEYLTPSGTDPPAPVTTQNRDPHATPSQARGHELCLASRHGDLQSVKRILAAGQVDINTRGVSSRTPVIWAAINRHRDVVKFLVGRGADLSLVDKFGNNVLHHACVSRDLVTIELILSQDVVDINARNNVGDTAADYAKRYGRQEVLDLLLSAAKSQKRTSIDPKPNMVPPAPVTTRDSNPQASTTEAGEDLTPSETDPPAPVTTQNCDPHATPSPAGRRLYSASMAGDLEKVKRILSAGHVNINTRGGRWRRTPVMMAALGGHSDVVEFLVGRGADMLVVNKRGDNVLHLACTGGYLETVQLILPLNIVDINSRGYHSKTPVMTAAKRGHRDVVEFLVGRGADVSLVDSDGNNALHWACDGGDLETVKMILSLDVIDINARNNAGKTAADLARVGDTKGHDQVLHLLVSRGAH